MSNARVTKEPIKLEDLNIETIRKIRIKLCNWEKIHYDNFPWRETKNKFHALIAELMLQRTRAEQVLPIYNVFVEKYPSLDDAVKESSNKMHFLLKPLGLNKRNDKIIDLIKVIHKLRNIPENKKDLIKLPGVGEYISNAYLSLHCNKKYPIIDSNAVRLWSRLFGFKSDAETRRKKWFYDVALHITPDDNFKIFNYAILDFSRKKCKINPIHNCCSLKDLCKFSTNLNNS